MTEPATLRLQHRILGERGPWVLVLHGLFGAGRNWQSIGKRLADDRRVCLVDLRNHGASPWAAPMRYPDLAGDVAALMVELGIDRASLVGHSMGGKVAMWLALARPERVARLAIVDIAPVAYGHDHANHLSAMRALDLQSIGSRAAADGALAAAVPDTGVRQFLLQNLVADGAGFRWRVNLGAITDAMADLTGFPTTSARFEGPTLAIVGAASAYVDDAGVAALKHYFPAIRLVRLDGVGHWPHAERPAVVADLLGEFLV